MIKFGATNIHAYMHNANTLYSHVFNTPKRGYLPYSIMRLQLFKGYIIFYYYCTFLTYS